MQSLLGIVSDLLLPSFECEEFRNSLTMPMLNCLWEDYFSLASQVTINAKKKPLYFQYPYLQTAPQE